MILFSGESPGPSDSEYVRKVVVFSKIKNLRAKKKLKIEKFDVSKKNLHFLQNDLFMLPILCKIQF